MKHAKETRKILLVLMAFWILALDVSDLWAARKDFKGLFGSYRRERFTENEARDSDLGVEILLSSLLPISRVVSSSQDLADRDNLASGSPMNYSIFTNVEGSVTFSLAYRWQFYGTIGYYSYDTRKETTNATDPDPLYHKVDISAIPLVGGVRYRFSTSDIVPYVGAGAGMSFVKRRATSESAPASGFDQSINAPTLHGQVGVEFYFSPRAGLRLELSGYYMVMPGAQFYWGGSTSAFPLVNFQENPLSVRYASGLFFLL